MPERKTPSEVIHDEKTLSPTRVSAELIHNDGKDFFDAPVSAVKELETLLVNGARDTLPDRQGFVANEVRVEDQPVAAGNVLAHEHQRRRTALRFNHTGAEVSA
jgi:hypothetical protein